MDSKEAYNKLINHPYFCKFEKNSSGKYNSFSEFHESVDWGVCEEGDKFWIEAGSWSCNHEYPEMACWYDDLDTHFYADTFDECLIKLAEFIIDKYGDVSYNDFYEDCELWELFLPGTTTRGDRISFMMNQRFSAKKFAEYRDKVSLETPEDYVENAEE